MNVTLNTCFQLLKYWEEIAAILSDRCGVGGGIAGAARGGGGGFECGDVALDRPVGIEHQDAVAQARVGGLAGQQLAADPERRRAVGGRLRHAGQDQREITRVVEGHGVSLRPRADGGQPDAAPPLPQSAGFRV